MGVGWRERSFSGSRTAEGLEESSTGVFQNPPEKRFVPLGLRVTAQVVDSVGRRERMEDMERIYLDHAATSFYRPDAVIEAVAEAMRTMGNDGRGTHGEALASSRIIYDARRLVDELFGGFGPSQVAFTANATQALNTAIKGVVNPEDTLITTVLEHNSVLRPAYEMEERGTRLRIAGCDRLGRLSYGELEAMMEDEAERIKREGERDGKKRKLVFVGTHASNLTGNLVDIRRIGRICAACHALYVLDASQTAGIFPIDMKKDGIAIVCFTGHKSLMGPQGTGGLCVRKGLAVRPLLSGGSGVMTYETRHPDVMPTALEAGTLNGHGIAGLRAGILYLNKKGAEPLRKKEQSLMRLFYEEVKHAAGVTLYGDVSSFDRAPILSLNIGDMDSGEVSDLLSEEYGIDTRSGGHCAPLMHRALGCVEQGAVRFSFSHFNTEEQVKKAAEAVKEIAK